MILRIHGKYATNIKSEIVALGGLRPENTLIFSDGRRCQIGKKNTGFGTVACMGGPAAVARSFNLGGRRFSADRNWCASVSSQRCCTGRSRRF